MGLPTEKCARTPTVYTFVYTCVSVGLPTEKCARTPPVYTFVYTCVFVGLPTEKCARTAIMYTTACEMPKFSLAGYMQLTCTVKKLFYFKHEITDARILHFDLGAKTPGVSQLKHTSLESPFDADVEV